VIRRLEDGTNEFSEIRWGFPPGRPKAPPIINFRSEGRRFPVGRCLVPASFFYEFTGKKSPKSKWKFTKVGEPWFCFAGLWRPMPEGGAAFTLLTTDPSPDVAPISGQTAGGVREILPVAEIMRRLVAETEAALARAPALH
jgi:putative SOS response-associated peptidase YedK